MELAVARVHRPPCGGVPAYYEHMPIRLRVAQQPAPGLRIYRRLAWGRLAEFTMLDDRQYRTDNPCGDGEQLRCDEALTGNYTMLGRQQERWLGRGFRESTARWNIVAQQLLIAQLEHATVQPNWFWQDAWDGYPLARQRLLEEVVDADVRNPVFLTGDWHSTFVNDLKLDFKDPNAATVATEFVTPAITTGGDGTPYGPYYAPMIPFNPHIKYYEGDRRGYFKARVTPQRMQLDLRFVTALRIQVGLAIQVDRGWLKTDSPERSSPRSQTPRARGPIAPRGARAPATSGSASDGAAVVFRDHQTR
jgi:alkaline phosphatase D